MLADAGAVRVTGVDRAESVLEAARAELEAARLELEQQAARDAAAQESARWPWDMDPFGFARDAAVRTVRTVTRRKVSNGSAGVWTVILRSVDFEETVQGNITMTRTRRTGAPRQ